MATGNRLKQMATAEIVGRVLLSAVFLLAATAKIRDYESFEITLNKSQLLGNGYAHWVGALIIAVELIAVAGLWFSGTHSISLYLITGLCCMFIGYSAWRWAQNIPVSCSCFGTLFKMAPWQSIVLNLGLLATTLFLFEANSPRLGSPQGGRANSLEAEPV